MQRVWKEKRTSLGFALVELLLVMGIMGILLGIVTINLSKVQRNTSIATAVETLIADMKSQQLNAMSGVSIGASGDSYGVYFDPSQKNKYVLFHGSTYAVDPTNFIVTFDSSIIITPSTNPIVFLQQSGEISTHADTTVTLTNVSGTEQETLTANRYGVISNTQ